MERLPVFKALGDNTRYAIYLELARSAVPLSTGELADALALHPNTVRPHLERMREVGLLDVDTDGQGQVGRPQHRYSVAPDAPSLGLEPSAFRLLARLVTGVAAKAGMDEDEVAEVGREHGRALAEAAMAEAAVAAAAASAVGAGGGIASAGGPSVRRSGGRGGRAGAQTSCLALVEAQLAELGFDPAVASDGTVTTIAFTRCPFREIAEAFPEVVCHLHRGIVEGMVAAAAGSGPAPASAAGPGDAGLDATILRFATLADRNPCEVDLACG